MPTLPSRRALLPLVGVLVLFSVAAYAVGFARHGRYFVAVKRDVKVTTPGGWVKYALRVNRTAKTRKRISMHVKGVPAGARIEWRRRGRVVGHVMRHRGRRIRLRVITGPRTPVGRYRLKVTARHKRQRAHRTVTLIVRRVKLGVAGTLTPLLAPGVVRPLDLTLTNPRRRVLTLDNVNVAIDTKTSAADCDGAANYFVRQMPRAAIRLRRGMTRLSDVLPADRWPQIGMYNLPVNQDACQGAGLTLRLSAEARRK